MIRMYALGRHARLPLIVVEWSLPLPGVDIRIISTPQAYVRATHNNGIVAIGCNAGDADGAANDEAFLEVRDDYLKKDTHIGKLCAVATINDANTLLRPEHAVISVEGIGFLVANNAVIEGPAHGVAEGKFRYLQVDDVDEGVVARKVEQIKENFAIVKGDISARFASLQSILAGRNLPTIYDANTLNEISATLDIAWEHYAKRNYVSMAGYLWLVFAPHVKWAKSELLRELYALFKERDALTSEYVIGACNFALSVLNYIIEVGIQIERVRQEDDIMMRVNTLRKVRAEVDKTLREIGGSDETLDEVARINKLLETKQLPDEVRAYIKRELTKLDNPYAIHWAETEVALKHINFLLELPWYERAQEIVPFSEVEAYLNNKLYGLRKAKDAVLDYLAALHKKQGSTKGTVLCFVGPPGTGKTDMARRIAEALRRPFYKISLGGVNDEAEIRGHRRTYVGALPGNIMKALARTKVKNPVILLDEIDKMQIGVRGDPSAALMEVLDPEFNHAFYDHFVDFPFDLSEVLFICAANVASNIPPALRDRLNIIEFRPYTAAEKFYIARDYIIPKVERELGLERGEVSITDDAIKHLIQYFTYESGVRELYRLTKKMITRNLRYAHAVITPAEVEQLLWDEPKMVWRNKRQLMVAERRAGIAPTLGVASDTGEGIIGMIMFRPIGTFEGNEDRVEITYNTDELTRQTLRLAIECAREHCGIASPPRYIWVVHHTNPSVRTTGTSFGVSAVLAALSVYLNKPLNPDYVYTGEIDVFGNIHAIGGVDAKIAIAEAAGYTRIYIPKENEHDLRALDFTPSIDVRLVSHIKEILSEGVFDDGD